MADTTFSFNRRKVDKARIEIITTPGNEISKNLTEFYLNPSSWTESKSTNWVSQAIPGTSDPHKQWVSGGDRTISFEAFVTNDLAEGHVASNVSNARKNNAGGNLSVVKRLGQIATTVFNLSGLDLNGVAQVNNAAGLNLDISDKLNYYRSLCYPNLTTDRNRVDSAPPFVRLVVGSTLGKRTSTTAVFVVNKIDITITKQYSDLTPIEARVTFTLTEFVDGILGANNDII